ncbi:hypothetical protein CVT25_000698 [Psilocybe cyanescens]|uniref:Uncharacterized protein n=1 Tax=Psilocybe cyanescens TaxID=93625 RepID=A0A409WZE8_PSICY|nr:hypothetical protein CVT25_000698 [Psilocybe cyanescens]
MDGIGLRPPGKKRLTFDVILSRQQGEVQKSRETGAELGGVMGAMGEVGDVLVGGPAAARSSSKESPAPVTIPASILTEVAGKKEAAAEGSGTSTTLLSPPPAEQMTSVGATSFSAAPATSSSQPTTTTASDNNDAHAPALPVGIIQDLQSQLRASRATWCGYASWRACCRSRRR